MKIILANTSGFCFGVNRAVTSVYESAKRYKMPIFTYGPIIHNTDVVNDLEGKGVKVINNLDELKMVEDGVVIIRSHGVSLEVYNTLKENNILSIDMTCPYVKKIHKIVKENSGKGYKIIIVGNPTHPEVEGINGWSDNKAAIVSTLEDCYALTKFEKICIVVQTTFSKEKWGPIREYLIESKCNESVDFNTICNSTSERQNEAAELSKSVDAMIVVGGKHSSNTQKLYNICKQNCDNTWHIENVTELNLEQVKKFNSVGVTSGASTPNWVVEKLVDELVKMDESNNVVNQETKVSVKQKDISNEELKEQSFEDMLNNFKILDIGDIVKGKVVAVNDDEAIIDIGYKSDAIIPASEMTDYAENLRDLLSIGETIEASVIGYNENDGSIVLSKKDVDVQKGWEEARKAFENKAIIMAKVLKETKGGAIAQFKALTIFIPYSQLSNRHVEVNELVGENIPVKIIEFEEGKNIVASSRVVLEENKYKNKLNFWENLYVGKDFIGNVKKLASYGAFVDIGGIDGLLHISEISWSKSDNAEKYINVDDKLEVYVKEFNKENEKIMLGLKTKGENPWTTISSNYNVGDIIEGKVVRLTTFGAFINIQEGIDGLVHISQISERRIKSPGEVLEVGEMVKVKITSIDIANKRIGLSIKDVAPIDKKGETNLEIEKNFSTFNENLNVTIGDSLKNWKFEEE